MLLLDMKNLVTNGLMILYLISVNMEQVLDMGEFI